MDQTTPFSGARLEKDGKVLDQNLSGRLVISRKEFQSSAAGSFSMGKPFYDFGMATLVAPGKFRLLVTIANQSNGVCHFSGADAPELGAGVS